jgi:site-specific recombinase XerD
MMITPSNSGRGAAVVSRDSVAVRHARDAVHDEAARHRATINDMPDEKKQKLHEYEVASLAPSSRRSYHSDYKQFQRWMSTHYPECQDLSQATWPMCVDWTNSQVEQGLSKATIVRRWAFLRSHLCLSLKDPVIQQDYTKVIKGLMKSIDEPDEKGKTPLMGPDLVRILQKMQGDTFDQCQHRMFLLFAFGTALRRSEIASLKWKSVRFLPKGISIHVKKSKTGQKTVNVNKKEGPLDCVQPLLAWKERFQPSDDEYIFRALNRQREASNAKIGVKLMTRYVKQAAESIQLKGSFAVHSVRSGCISTHAANGAGLAACMKLSQHKSLSSLQHYLKGQDFDHGL